ncbi:uncharacterized protein Dwil_GK17166 [Drosophila willistoni]|uniref:Uncharacterized protein n=1 Tax=Drosophila willistoni TaxID=7260 RepID=B4MKN0_DROWI|nr:protein arginine N-methyltransferase 1-A [Drosophila willistoni]EDW72736.1 uncharacterized protein Dwil_GK17166 [Drosophila willistoni]
MEAEESVISPSVYLEFLATQEVIMRDYVMLDFKDAMEANGQLFENAVVLEIGCGSALLSMWAARLGAARVIAQEPTPVAQVARQLVSQNQLDHIIEVIEGDIKEITMPVNKFDVIISKWMGACLMYNKSLDAVLYARDKWLKSDGYIFPCNARLYLTAATENRNYVPPKRFWSRFAGLNMSYASQIVQRMPLVAAVPADQLLAKSELLKTFDLMTLKRNDLSFTTKFCLPIVRKCIAHWFVVYFEFDFPHNDGVKTISTSPLAPCTQWKQTLFHIDEHLPLCVNDTISGLFVVKRGDRHLDFDINWRCQNDLINIRMHKQICRMQGKAANM